MNQRAGLDGEPTSPADMLLEFVENDGPVAVIRDAQTLHRLIGDR
jgi:hypothetical protein